MLAGPCWARLCQVGLAWARLGQVGPGWAWLGQVGLCWARPCSASWARLGFVMVYFVLIRTLMVIKQISVKVGVDIYKMSTPILPICV